MRIRPADVSFNQHGTPVANDFDDVYYSNHDGEAESRYVFLEGNGLPERWQQSAHSHFTIAESGFGTGLNFFVTALEFIAFTLQFPKHKLKRLYFLSSEQFPLNQEVFAAIKRSDQFSALADEVTEHYPHLATGNHRMILAGGKIVLDLCFDDIQTCTRGWQLNHTHGIDAWYLDGFAPNKNPGMWQQSLFNDMTRLASDEGTFATFSATGFVRRGLSDAGFDVKKRKGFGRKREMLTGKMPKFCEASQTVERQTCPPLQNIHFRRGTAVEQKIAIVGGGIAGNFLAYSLLQRGCQVAHFDSANEPGAGASGNKQGGFYPQLHAQFSIPSRIQMHSFEFACHFYRRLLSQGIAFDHAFCGTLQLGFSTQTQDRLDKLINGEFWPTSLLQAVNSEEASSIAGVDLPAGGIFFADGGWISPHSLVQGLHQYATDFADYAWFGGHKVQDICKTDAGWKLRFENGKESTFSTLVLANATHASQLIKYAAIPLQAVRGQIEYIPQAPARSAPSPQCVICHKGYMTPSDGRAWVIGSSYVKNDEATDYRVSEQAFNWDTHLTALQEPDWLSAHSQASLGRASIRACTPDHQPLVGAIPDEQLQRMDYRELRNGAARQRQETLQKCADQTGLYILSGLGSRGLTTGPLMAELLASQLCSEPLPLSDDLLAALSPNRFLIRALKRSAC